MIACHSPSRLAPGTKARILYVNGDGFASERDIDVIRVFSGSNGLTYLRAFCHLRGEERTFRADRILALLAADCGPSPVPVRTVPHPHPQDSRRPRPVASGIVTGTGAHAETGRAQTKYQSAEIGKAGVGRRRGPGRLVLVCGLALCGLWLWTRAGEQIGGRPATAPRLEGVVAAASVPPIPSPPPAPVVAEGRYRGQLYRIERVGGSTRYTVAQSGEVFSGAHEMRTGINRKLFEMRTGIRNERLFALYAGVDADRDGEISWEEVGRFQQSLKERYAYRTNSLALRPDEFMAAGGGDCEDWALMTAGMLRYWGIPVFVCSLGGADWAHAVAIVPTEHLPKGARTIDVPEGGEMPAGRYVPIDYEHVGRLSNAVQPGYRLNWIRVPEEIYGWQI